MCPRTKKWSRTLSNGERAGKRSLTRLRSAFCGAAITSLVVVHPRLRPYAERQRGQQKSDAVSHARRYK